MMKKNKKRTRKETTFPPLVFFLHHHFVILMAIAFSSVQIRIFFSSPQQTDLFYPVYVRYSLTLVQHFSIHSYNFTFLVCCAYFFHSCGLCHDLLLLLLLIFFLLSIFLPPSSVLYAKHRWIS